MKRLVQVEQLLLQIGLFQDTENIGSWAYLIIPQPLQSDNHTNPLQFQLIMQP